jgi:nicotinamidase-related amidase
MDIIKGSQEFLNYLRQWYEEDLRPLPLETVIAGDPSQVAVLSVDLLNGFCREGSLASPRIEGVIPAVTNLFQRAYDAGIRALALAEDSHPEDSPEFQAFPPHCIAGTRESRSVEELRNLPFYDEMTIIKKQALGSQVGTGLPQWIRQDPPLKKFVVIGDCTDLCVYHTAMFLRMDANARGLADVEVIVPANAVETFDIPVKTAREQGIYAHDADLHHVLFLHHLAMNNVTVVSEIS